MSVFKAAAGGVKYRHAAVEFMTRYATDSSFRQKINNAISAGVGWGKWGIDKLRQMARDSEEFAERRKSKRIKTEAGLDPQNHNTHKATKLPPLGVSTLFAAGEVIERPLSLGIGSRKYNDVLRNFLRELNYSRIWKSQFACQYVGDDQVRSCHGMLFRHREPRSRTNVTSRQLKNSMSYESPMIGIPPQLAIAGLPYNFFDASTDNMKCMLGTINMYDIEEIAASITPPHANSLIDTWGTRTQLFAGLNQVGVNQVPAASNLGTLSSSALWVHSYLQNLDNTAATLDSVPKVTVAVKTGGVKLFFENKHPVGAYVEIVMYKMKREDVRFAGNWVSSGYDTIMDDLERACGQSYVRDTVSGRAVDYGTGHQPNKTDVTISPYYPLLPQSHSRGGSFENDWKNKWTEKTRTKFALASGHKRHVNLSFGGCKYDPRYTVSDDCSEAVLVVIAINGQMISALAENGVNQLITGDICAGHNMFVRGEYYEDICPLKVDRNLKKQLYCQFDMEPSIPLENTTNVTVTPYMILPVNKAQRGDNTKMEAGVKVDNTDGYGADDIIQA